MAYPTLFCGTIKPKEFFNVDVTVDHIENAIKSGNKDRIMEILVNINNVQRQMIRTPYKVKYGKDLVEELKKKFSGSFGGVIYGLIETPTKYDAYQLYKAIKGPGTVENTLIEILCSRTNEELQGIINQYKNDYYKSLENDIISDTSGSFKKLLVALLQATRDEANRTDENRATQDALKLIPNDEKKRKGIDKDNLNAILVGQNFRQLKRVFSEYERLSGQNIEKAIEKEFSGDAKQGFLSLIQCIESKPKYFAQQLSRATKGFFKDENNIIRVIVTRCEIDLALIREEFEGIVGKPLTEWLKSECSSSCRDILIAIVTGN